MYQSNESTYSLPYININELSSQLLWWLVLNILPDDQIQFYIIQSQN